MPANLDRTQQRILGVLLEKELSTPENYPLTENALLAGCNQKSNRDPVFSLQPFELEGALKALRMEGWVHRSEREGGRTHRYRHALDEKLGIDRREKAVLAELLLRGPQAPGALRPRLARMGVEGATEEVAAVLDGLAARAEGGLAEKLPRRPREREERWAHRLGPRGEEAAQAGESAGGSAGEAAGQGAWCGGAVPPPAGDDLAALRARLEELERQVEQLRTHIEARQRPGAQTELGGEA